MTRFREEHYATRAHKAFTRGKRSAEGTVEAHETARREEYFQKPLSVRKAILKAQKAKGRLDGF